MALTFSNLGSLPVQRSLQESQKSLQSSMSKLSSGYRINSAMDDAAGLAISEALRADLRSLNQAQRNAFDAVSVVQTAEGGMSQASDILIRMRELAMQSANGSLGDDQRSAIQGEYNQLQQELDRISNTQEFNGQKLLNGDLATQGLDFQVGTQATSNDQVTVTVPATSASALGVDSTSVANQAGAQDALANIDQALQTLSNARAGMGATENRVNSVIANLGVASENTAAANSRIRDVDVAVEVSRQISSAILLQAGVALLSQANASQASVLGLLKGSK